MLKEIPKNEITREPASLVDEVGVVFYWRNNIYRAIKNEYSEFYKNLFDTNNIQELFGKGLIETELTDLSLEGFGLVLRHKRVPFVSYNVEWCAEMLKDAALLICDLSAGLYARGLALKDSHPWNILFDKGKPFYIDWGSIVSLKNQAGWPYHEFRSKFIFPLLLMSAGKSWIARRLMIDTLHSPTRSDVYRLIMGRVSKKLMFNFFRADRYFSRYIRKYDLKFFNRLRKMIESIPFTYQKTNWTNYEGPGDKYCHDYHENWPAKIQNIFKIVRDCKPKTVLDIGCNRGWFSELAAKHGASVVSMDLDESNLTQVYKNVRENGLPILPVTMDICSPTPPHGINMAYKAPEKRFRADMVMALALIHHLTFKRGFTFEAIAKLFADFTERWLLVEFVPPDDIYVKEWMSERFKWYDLDGFVNALSTYFSRYEIFDSTPQPRILVLFER